MPKPAITTATFGIDRDAHKLIGSRAINGTDIFIPPRPFDPKDITANMEMVELSGKGTLVSFSIVPVASSEMIAAGYGKDNPHCVGIVKLDEGPSVSAQIIGVDVKHPESIALGMPMQVEFIDRTIGGQTKTVLAFRPA
jgi:uncharacterized protein